MPHSNSLYNALVQPFVHLRSSLATLDAETLARASGFLRRRPRKIPMADLLLGLCALAGESFLSLERIAALIALAAQCSYSKQAFHQRLSEKLQHFLAAVALRLFGQLSAPLQTQGAFKAFGRVLLHDSTVQSLPRRLAAVFPGSASQTSKNGAALKIQWVCDLLSGSLLHLSLSGFRRNDQAAAGDVLNFLQAGDLVLRDLGYFSLPIFSQIMSKGAFLLSRLRNGVLLRDPKTKKEIDLLRLLRRDGRLDRNVLVGAEQVPMRLVVLPVPQEVANQRRARARSSRNASAPSAKRLALMNWSPFVTNVPPEVWPAEAVAQIYRLRWRVEIIFKSWKSCLRLHELNCRSADLVRLSVMLKLFYCLLTANCFNSLENLVGRARHVSLLRLSRLMGHCGLLISAILLQISPEKLLAHYLANHAFYEHRNDRKNFVQRLTGLASKLP